MKKYKILLTCYDFDEPMPYFDEVIGVFNSKLEAEKIMLECAIGEMENLCGILDEDGAFPELRFVPTMQDEEYNLVINAWDGPDYRPVTGYNVMSVNELLEFFNAKLRNTHGDKITVRLYSYEEDDGNIWFYYTSEKHGESDAYLTANEAYHHADDYLRGVGELW